MKLLLDENLSFRLVSQIEPAFPGSAYVDSVSSRHKRIPLNGNSFRNKALFVVRRALATLIGDTGSDIR